MVDPRVPVETQVAHVADRLSHDYAGQVPDGVVRSMVDDAFRTYAHVRVTQFVPVLVDRSVRQRLRQARRAD